MYIYVNASILRLSDVAGLVGLAGVAALAALAALAGLRIFQILQLVLRYNCCCARITAAVRV